MFEEGSCSAPCLMDAPLHLGRYGQPDPLYEPEAYLNWLLDPLSPFGHGPLPPTYPTSDNSIRPSSWYVAVVAPHTERATADELERDRIETFVPLKRQFRRATRPGRRATIERPLFAGYVFSHVNCVDPLLASRNIRMILPRSDSPRPVPTIEIERLKGLELLGEFDETVVGRKGWDRSKPRGVISWIQKGVVVKIVDGPFNKHEAIIEAVDSGNRRVKVSIDVFGRATLVIVGFAQISRAC